MAFDPKPSTWLGAGYTVASHLVCIETADAANSNKTLAGLTDAEADPTTGDIRKVVYEIMEALYKARVEIATADLPTKMTIARSASVNATTGEITYTYTVKCYCTATAQDVTDEPA